MIPCYVIHLGNSFENKKSLENVGLYPIGFKGIDSRKDEHIGYTGKINPICKHFCPKSTIGCGLSHILLAENLYNEGTQLALILEDDAYPKFSKFDLNKILEDVPDDWEIIRLHCDMYCDNSNKVKLNGSTAAYLINWKGIQKQKDIKLAGHVDAQTNFMSGIKVYKTKQNIFTTDENNSNIRGSYKIHWLTYFLSNPTSGEKRKEHFFAYKYIRIPYFNTELTLGNIIDILLVVILIIIFCVL